MKYVQENLVFADAKLDVIIVRMGAIMDDPVHVQIQVIKLGNLVCEKKFAFFGLYWRKRTHLRLLDQFTQARITFANVAKEFRNPHFVGSENLCRCIETGFY